MMFSPEQPEETKELTMDMLRKVLDEKFKEYLSPVQKQVQDLHAEMQLLKTQHSKDINNLKSENNNLKEELQRLEVFQRKNNISFLTSQRYMVKTWIKK